MSVNIEKPDFDEPREQEGFRAQRAPALNGTPSLRTPGGWRDLEQGDVVSFLRGEAGAHQIVNRTDRPIRFLAFSPSGDADVVLQPDSGKVGAFERRADGGGMRVWFRMEDQRDYYDGESAPG